MIDHFQPARTLRAFATTILICVAVCSLDRELAAEVTMQVSDLAAPAPFIPECNCDESAHTYARAGNPQRVAWWALPSVDHRYKGYYLGGGAVVHGEGRASHEGIWGVDYVGSLIKRRVNSGWWHGRRKQGGTGAYETEGPHVWKQIKKH